MSLLDRISRIEDGPSLVLPWRFRLPTPGVIVHAETARSQDLYSRSSSPCDTPLAVGVGLHPRRLLRLFLISFYWACLSPR